MQILVYIIVFLMIAIIFQFIYIHQQLDISQKKMREQTLRIKNKAEEMVNKENKLRIYPVEVDLNFSRAIHNQSSNLKDNIKNIIDNTENIILPYTCDKGIINVKVHLNKIGILVVHRNYGADNFYEDVLNKRVQYVIIKNKVFSITAKNEIDTIIADHFDNINQKEKAAMLRYNKRCIVLLPLLNHTILPEDVVKVNKFCRYNIYPFFGKMAYIGDTSKYLFDPTLEFAYDVPEENVLVHLLTYKAY